MNGKVRMDVTHDLIDHDQLKLIQTFSETNVLNWSIYSSSAVGVSFLKLNSFITFYVSNWPLWRGGGWGAVHFSNTVFYCFYFKNSGPLPLTCCRHICVTAEDV